MKMFSETRTNFSFSTNKFIIFDLKRSCKTKLNYRMKHNAEEYSFYTAILLQCKLKGRLMLVFKVY